MSTTTFSQAQGTTILWTPDSAPLFDITSLASGSAWQGAAVDLGATFAERYGWRLITKGASAFTAGNPIETYLSFSPDNTNFAGGATGSDGAFSDTDDLANLLNLRGLRCDNDTNAHILVGMFYAMARYVAPVLRNGSGQALTATDADHRFSIWPLNPVGVTA